MNEKTINISHEIEIFLDSKPVHEILELSPLTLAPITHVFQALGEEIPRKLEKEQGFVLRWLLTFALRHGEKWRQAVGPYFQSMAGEVKARENLRWKDGEPCGHAGCLSHKSHACEGCGRYEGWDIRFQLRRYHCFCGNFQAQNITLLCGNCGGITPLKTTPNDKHD